MKKLYSLSLIVLLAFSCLCFFACGIKPEQKTTAKYQGIEFSLLRATYTNLNSGNGTCYFNNFEIQLTLKITNTTSESFTLLTENFSLTSSNSKIKNQDDGNIIYPSIITAKTVAADTSSDVTIIYRTQSLSEIIIENTKAEKEEFLAYCSKQLEKSTFTLTYKTNVKMFSFKIPFRLNEQ